MSFQSTLRVPWLSFAKSLPLYALAVAHFTCNWGYYTLLTCLPQYFKHILHFDIKSVSAVILNRAYSFLVVFRFASLSSQQLNLIVRWLVRPSSESACSC